MIVYNVTNGGSDSIWVGLAALVGAATGLAGVSLAAIQFITQQQREMAAKSEANDLLKEALKTAASRLPLLRRNVKQDEDSTGSEVAQKVLTGYRALKDLLYKAGISAAGATPSRIHQFNDCIGVIEMVEATLVNIQESETATRDDVAEGIGHVANFIDLTIHEMDASDVSQRNRMFPFFKKRKNHAATPTANASSDDDDSRASKPGANGMTAG